MNTTAEKDDAPEDKDLTNDDPGLDSNIESAIPEIERLADKTVEDKVTMDNVGMPDVITNDTTALAPPGLSSDDKSNPGAEGNTGSFTQGTTGGANGLTSATLSPAAAERPRAIWLREGGGNEASERAVAMALAWLAKQQREDGGWKFDVGRTEERIAATGLALLPFLAAGDTHKKSPEKNQKGYDKVVDKGLEFLKKNCPIAGPAAGHMSFDMYAQAIGTIPLCEAYGMTKDPGLRPFAQAAINYIQKAQAPNGSWGYGPGVNGDTSIVGWQIQALQGRIAQQGHRGRRRVIKKAVKFLDIAGAGSQKSMYGYADNAGAAPGTA